MVKEVTKLVNSLPKKGGVHSIQSPRMIITGVGLHVPTTKCGQYVQGHVGGTNDTEVERTVDSLYIGANDNGSGHWVFKLDTKERVSVNRVTVIPMSEDFIQRINEMGKQDHQPAGLQLPDGDGNLTILDFLTPESDDDSHASDESYKYSDEASEADVPLNVETTNEGLLDSELQRDHFQRQDNLSIGDDDNDISVSLDPTTIDDDNRSTTSESAHHMWN